MREMINMIVVLTVLTAVSGGLLATVQSSTEERIENQVLKFQKAPAIEGIFPDVTNDPIQERFTVNAEGIEIQVFPGEMADGSKAVAFETKGTGFGGPIGFMIGVNLETDEIVAARVTTHSETPGIGSRLKDEPDFASQFSGLDMNTNFALKKNNGAIDAVSGATVTSDGLAQAAIQAHNYYKKLKPEILKQIK